MSPDLEPRSKVPAFFNVLLVLASAGLLACSIYRAATYSFTHDESLSFAIFSWRPAVGDTTNHHLLNTWAIQCCSMLFGNSEFALRLHTLVAHGIYLAAGLALLKRLRHPVLQLSGFVLLNLNPFLLDFFFVARGYGMSLAFEMTAIFMLVRAREEIEGRGFEKALLLSAAFGALSVLSNYTFLNFYLPNLLAIAVLLQSRRSMMKSGRSSLWITVVLLLFCGSFLTLILAQLFRIRGHGGFWWGGQGGFVADTVLTFVVASLYGVDYPGPTGYGVAGIFAGLFGLMAVLVVCRFFARKKDPHFYLLFFVLAGAVALPVLENRILRMPYPVERAALYYLPLYMLTLLFACDAITPLAVRGWRSLAGLAVPVMIAVMLILHFCISFNVSTCYLWAYDAHTRDAIEIIARDRGTAGHVQLLDDWRMEPAMNFYRVTRHYAWMEPVTRKVPGSANYFYLLAGDIKKIPPGSCTVLAVYPDSQTALLKANAPARSSSAN
ncbi:MAG: glycosyltransferase family 39 protein [Verrucomicrobiota bacterium]